MICEFTVPMREFRAALVSVLPHVETEKDGIAELKAMRVDVGEDALIVSATDRRTAAASTCRVDGFDSDLPQVVGIDDLDAAMRPFESFRLDPEQAKHLAQLFVPGKVGEEWTLNVQIHEKKAIVTDVSGIVPGETLTMPMTPIDARFRVTLAGGVVIDMTALDMTDPAVWCEVRGVKVVDVDGVQVAIMYKAVGDNWSTDRGTDYSPGSTPEAPDWAPSRACGNGLHFGVSPVHSADYYRQATRYVRVGVRLDEMVPLDDKAKARRVVMPCVAVDRHGDDIPAEAATAATQGDDQ